MYGQAVHMSTPCNGTAVVLSASVTRCASMISEVIPKRRTKTYYLLPRLEVAGLQLIQNLKSEDFFKCT